MKPTSEVEAPPKLFQYPFLRVLTQGRIGVAIFALVTGYVCALKPIRQIRAGDRNAMFNGVSKSAFRRVPRLILPTAIATTITWFFCQFGVFQVAEKADSWWLNFSAPRMTPYIGEAIYSLLLEMIMTWSRGWNMYDHHTWTMLPLLKSSMLVFIFLFAAAYCKTRYRIMVELGLFVYFYVSNDCKSYVNPPLSPHFYANSRQQLLECSPSLASSSPISPKTQPTKAGATPANGQDDSSPPSSSFLGFTLPPIPKLNQAGCPGPKQWKTGPTTSSPEKTTRHDFTPP